MAPRDRRNEAYQAGFENPLAGDIGPLQRLYGTLQGIGEEFSGGDMGTPFGQRFGERQKATKKEIQRLQELRAAHPEEFGRGMMMAQEQMDPYMLDLGISAGRAMRPAMGTRFSPVREMPAGGTALEGPAPVRALPPPTAPVEPYYRNVPPEMGTSTRPMNAFQQNTYGMTTGRYGPMGAQYAPEMAVSDFESYGPMGARPAPGPYAPSGFDRNMLDAYRQGRYNRMRGGRPSMAGEYTPEEMGSAIVPYREGGLTFEPVSGPGEVYGLGGPQPSMGSRMAQGAYNYQPEMTRGFDPRVAAAVIGGGAGFAAGRRGEGPEGRSPRQVQLPPIDIGVSQPLQGQLVNSMYGFGPRGGVPSYGYDTGMPGAEAMPPASPSAAPSGGRTARTAGGSKSSSKGGTKAAPTPEAQAPAFNPNLNYQITAMIDQLLGGREAERGREAQQYYATNPWPY